MHFKRMQREATTPSFLYDSLSISGRHSVRRFCNCFSLPRDNGGARTGINGGEKKKKLLALLVRICFAGVTALTNQSVGRSRLVRFCNSNENFPWARAYGAFNSRRALRSIKRPAFNHATLSRDESAYPPTSL